MVISVEAMSETDAKKRKEKLTKEDSKIVKKDKKKKKKKKEKDKEGGHGEYFYLFLANVCC